jgi:nucleotide-binding universal stress UspA family protein
MTQETPATGLFRRILVPVDFTAENERALDVALELAGAHGSTVTLLHVIKTVDAVPFADLESFYRKLEAEARAKLVNRESRFRASKVPVEAAVALGRRVEELVLFARHHGIDLIVMSSRRIDAASPASYWGAISHKVAILADCPVMLVKSGRVV